MVLSDKTFQVLEFPDVDFFAGGSKEHVSSDTGPLQGGSLLDLKQLDLMKKCPRGNVEDTQGGVDAKRVHRVLVQMHALDLMFESKKECLIVESRYSSTTPTLD